MELEPEACYRALRTRDARFDGRFFTAVRSTGIYCRPVCPARTPKRDNCLFVPCAAAAEAAGFRPCRRCRPEAAPGSAAWLGTSATVNRALRLIADGALDRGGVADLAARLGVGERHLRRLFLRHLGASPLAIAQTRRAHFAAKLLAETGWPMSRVAFAAGYTSVRRFNEGVKQTFHCPPKDLRNRRGGAGDADPLAIRVGARAPFDFAALTRYLAARAVPGVETIGDGVVRRALRLDDQAVVVEVRASGSADELSVRVRGGDATAWLRVTERVRVVFDLGADPGEIARVLDADPALRARREVLPGVRVPGAWEPFELAARIVLGQQVTVAGATRLAGRIAERFGDPLPNDLRTCEAGPQRLFPTPEVLADAPLESLGLTRRRAGALRHLAAAVADGRVDLAPGADPAATRDALLALPGIGPWTADLVLMRGLNQPDAFPAGDLGLRRVLECDGTELERRSERWRPWRAYAAMLLWNVPTIPRASREGHRHPSSSAPGGSTCPTTLTTR